LPIRNIPIIYLIIGPRSRYSHYNLTSPYSPSSKPVPVNEIYKISRHQHRHGR
jgi:hypothetical protein